MLTPDSIKTYYIITGSLIVFCSNQPVLILIQNSLGNFPNDCQFAYNRDCQLHNRPPNLNNNGTPSQQLELLLQSLVLHCRLPCLVATVLFAENQLVVCLVLNRLLFY